MYIHTPVSLSVYVHICIWHACATNSWHQCC